MVTGRCCFLPICLDDELNGSEWKSVQDISFSVGGVEA